MINLYSRTQGSGILLLLIYVNDILLIGSSFSQIDKFITHLSFIFHMKDLGDIHYFLSLQIICHASTVTHTRYLLSLLQTFGLDGTKLVSTPLVWGPSMYAVDGAPLVNPFLYRCLVGSL